MGKELSFINAIKVARFRICHECKPKVKLKNGKIDVFLNHNNPYKYTMPIAYCKICGNMYHYKVNNKISYIGKNDKFIDKTSIRNVKLNEILKQLK